MIHGYHVVLPHYGFWLPNDPRGSWSQFVARWELARFGTTTRHCERRSLSQLSASEHARRNEIRKSLLFPPVRLSGIQARSIAVGFSHQSRKSQYQVWACSILPEHTHLVLARHRYDVEQMTILLKGAATRQLVMDGIHPLKKYTKPGKRPPSVWARRLWKVYLESDEAIENAINYVIENPLKEQRPEQSWRFVSPFKGIGPGQITYY